MMALRKFPYGYVMERGEVIVNDSEAEIIRWIFENRARGRSIWEMARELHNGTDPYFRDTVKKGPARSVRSFMMPGISVKKDTPSFLIKNCLRVCRNGRESRGWAIQHRAWLQAEKQMTGLPSRQKPQPTFRAEPFLKRKRH